MRKKWKGQLNLVMLVVICFVAPAVNAQSIPTAGKLATKLDEIREPCSTDASKRANENSIAAYKEKLAAGTARLDIEMDAKVYAVGHGSRETTQYMLERYRQNAEDDKAKAEARAEKSRQDAKAVALCIAEAEASGKSIYVGFKGGKRTKAMLDEANSVMTTWLVNIRTITLDAPKGSDQSKSDWEKAKTQAELGSL